MEDQQKIQLFERTPIHRAVMTMSIPTILSSLVMVLYNLADTYFVGMLNDPIQNAGVTLAAPVLLAFNAINNLFGVGTSSMMSRSLGRRDYDVVRRCSAFGFYCALGASLLFSLGCTALKSPLLVLLGADTQTVGTTGAYLHWTVTCGAVPAIMNVVMAYLVRSEGASLHASLGTMSGCLLNILLDPLFILPRFLNMGAAGAGLATFLSNCFACCYFAVLLAVRRGKTYVCVSPRMFRFDRKIAAEICAVGIPASIQNLLNVTGMTVLNNLTAAVNSDAVAAMGIAQKLTMIPVQVALGFSQGVMPMVSYNFGSKNYARMKKSILFALKVSLSALIMAMAVYLLGAGTLVWLFMKNEAVVAYGSRFLRGMCLCFPFMGLDFLAVGVFQACGMGHLSLLFALLRKIVVEIPALYLWNFLWPLYGLAYAQPTAELVMAVAAVTVLVRLFRRLERETKRQGAA